MAITKLTYNSPSGITFNNVSSPGASDATFIGKSKILAGFDKQISQSDLNEYGLTPILQALQIDWNGAQLKNGSTVKATLNTTGEGLSKLKIAI